MTHAVSALYNPVAGGLDMTTSELLGAAQLSIKGQSW